MAINVRPEGWEPPPPASGKGRPPRPEIAVALDNPGLWIECDWDPELWKQPDSSVAQRRVRHREVWFLRKSRNLRKLWLMFDGKSDD